MCDGLHRDEHMIIVYNKEYDLYHRHMFTKSYFKWGFNIYGECFILYNVIAPDY